MRAVTTAFRSSPLHQQLAATACLCCLISSLALVALAAQSSSHSQANLQSEYGKAVAEQLARRLGVELATGDRLGIAGELSKLTEQQSIVAARALDVDKRELAVTRSWLRSKGNSIEGGTSEVQLNVIAKRVLGLPDA